MVSAALGSLREKRSIFRWFRGNPRDFRGTVTADRFRIRRVFPFAGINKSVLVVLYGRFNSRPEGIEVDVHISFGPFTMAALILFFLLGGYELASYLANWITTKSLDPGLGFTLLIMLIAYAMITLSFNHQANLAEDFINGVFHRHRTNSR
jgi:hypothetical protein